MTDFGSYYLPAGLVIGLAAAAPVGPINLLVIQRTLTRGQGPALIAGAAAALGDTVFAIVAAFGLGAALRLLDAHSGAVRVVGGLIMLGFALLIWRSSPLLDHPQRELPTPRLGAMILGMTLTNPATLFFFLGSFGAVGFDAIGHGSAERLWNSALVVAGVFAGSMLWWLMISSAARALRGRVRDHHLRWLNRITAAALALFGAGAIFVGVGR